MTFILVLWPSTCQAVTFDGGSGFTVWRSRGQSKFTFRPTVWQIQACCDFFIHCSLYWNNGRTSLNFLMTLHSFLTTNQTAQASSFHFLTTFSDKDWFDLVRCCSWRDSLSVNWAFETNTLAVSTYECPLVWKWPRCSWHCPLRWWHTWRHSERLSDLPPCAPECTSSGRFAMSTSRGKNGAAPLAWWTEWNWSARRRRHVGDRVKRTRSRE